MNKELLNTKETLTVHVLFRYNAKSGNIDTTMTGLGNALLKMWALNNTTKSKNTMIFNRNTGELIFFMDGKTQEIKTKRLDKNIGFCNDFGITLEELQNIKDDRFD